jgi:hypothetical protein
VGEVAMPRRGIWTTQRGGNKAPSATRASNGGSDCVPVRGQRRGAARSETHTVVLLDVAGDPSPRLRLGWLRQRERERNSADVVCRPNSTPFCFAGTNVTNGEEVAIKLEAISSK